MLSNNSFPCSVIGIISNVDMVKVADFIRMGQGSGVCTSAKRSQHYDHWHAGLKSSLYGDRNCQGAGHPRTRPARLPRFHSQYRRDAQYLLFLKKPKDREFTANWAALAPVNEQLRSSEDP